VLNDLLADRSEQQPREAAEAASAEDDKRRVSALREKHVRRLPLYRQRFSVQRGPQLLRHRERSVGDVLCRHAKGIPRHGIRRRRDEIAAGLTDKRGPVTRLTALRANDEGAARPAHEAVRPARASASNR
jgi:hypothetical protein